jgi:hypothetical protein
VFFLLLLPLNRFIIDHNLSIIFSAMQKLYKSRTAKVADDCAREKKGKENCTGEICIKHT